METGLYSVCSLKPKLPFIPAASIELLALCVREFTQWNKSEHLLSRDAEVGLERVQGFGAVDAGRVCGGAGACSGTKLYKLEMKPTILILLLF